MAIPSGLEAQIGFAAETVYGTRVAPVRFLDLVEESLTFDPGRTESSAIHPGNFVLPSDRWRAGRKQAGGSVAVPVTYKGLGLLFEHALGQIASSQPDAINSPTVWEHKATCGVAAKSMTVQVGRPDTTGVVRPFDYVGGTPVRWELTQALDEDPQLSIEFDCRDEDTAQALGVASYATPNPMFAWDELVVSLDGSPIDVSSFTLSAEIGKKTDRYFVGTRLKKQPLPNAFWNFQIELEGEFEGMAAYDRLRNGDMVTFSAVWTGAIIEDAFAFAIEVDCPSVRTDGGTPTVGSPDVVPQSLTLKALDDGSADAPIAITYRTSDTTP